MRMAKESEGYGFNVGGDWVYPDYNKPIPKVSSNTKNNTAHGTGAPHSSYGYDPSDVRRQMAASRPEVLRTPYSEKSQKHPYPNGTVYPVKAVRSADMGRERNTGMSHSGGSRAIHDNRTVKKSSGAYGADAQRRNAAVHSASAANRNARRIQLTEEQRASYERAYMAKHGRSPYVNRESASYAPPADKRRAHLREEEIRLRRELEKARLEEQRLLEEQERAHRAAETERRRREAAARRAAEERVREAERQKLELERRRAYEKNKRKFELQRRAEEERERAEKRRFLEKKRRRRRFMRAVALHMRLVLVTFLVTSLVIGLCGYLKFWTDEKKTSANVTYVYGTEKISRVPSDIAYYNGIMCVDFIRLANMLGFYTVGDSESIKFIIPDGVSEQYITIVPDSSYVEINGSPMLLSVPARHEGQSLWVSSEIMSFFAGGITFETGVRNASVSKVVSRDEKGDPLRDAEGNYVYDKIELLYADNSAPLAPELSVIYGDEGLGIGLGTVVSFSADIGNYENYMNPSNSTEYLVLANKQNLLASDYIPKALSDVEGADGIALCLYAARSLEAMLIEMEAAGYGDVKVTSGYISYQAQLDEFNAHVAAEMAKGYDENEAMRLVLAYYSAPGTNEHQTGLAVDMHNLEIQDASFANEEAYIWLKDNAWKFGYILRYPEDAEDVTGHAFEPWHYRYVGRYAAEKIYKTGSTLEEYLGGR